MAEAEPRMTDLADDAGLLADDAHLPLFAKTHLAEAVGNFRRCRKLLDAHGSARPDLIQRAKLRLPAMFRGASGQRIVHGRQRKIAARELQDAIGRKGPTTAPLTDHDEQSSKVERLGFAKALLLWQLGAAR